MSDRHLLANAGTISGDKALAKVEKEYYKFRAIENSKPRPVDAHLVEVIEQAKQIATAKTKRKPRGDKQ